MTWNEWEMDGPEVGTYAFPVTTPPSVLPDDPF